MLHRHTRSTRRGARVSCDALEPRVLLSTINWTNKGTATSDTDGFAAAYGPVLDVRAREIVQRAVDDWARVIVNFNRPAGGSNTFNVVIEAQDLPSGLHGASMITGYDSVGKPMSAQVKLDAGQMWYFDPFVGPAHRPDDSEFTTVLTPFAARSIGLGDDLYTVALHELGHSMGLSSTSSRLSSMATDIGDDPVDSGAGRLFTLDTNGVPGADFTYTNASGIHLYEGPTVAGCPTHPLELMNAGRAHVGGTRNLISDTFATLLRDVFAYSILLPSQANTFYVQFNDTANSVTIIGDIRTNGNDNEFINIRRSTSFQVFEVNGTREGISTVEFFSVVINANLGNDIILIDELKAGAPTTINAGPGDDALELAPTTRNLDDVPSPVTFLAGTGFDTVRLRDSSGTNADAYTITPTLVDRVVFGGVTMSAVERVELTAQTGNNTFDLKADPATTYHFDGGGGTDSLAFNETASTADAQYTIRNLLVQRTGFANVTYASTTESVRFDAGSGNDSFTFTPGDVFGVIGFNGNGGNDSLVVDDRANTGADGYIWFGNSLQKSVVGNPPGTNPPATQWLGIETATFHANDDNNTIDVLSTLGATSIFSNGGNDTVKVNDGTATVNTGAESPSAAAPFADTLGINLDATSGEDQGATVIIDQNDDVRDVNVMSANTVGTLRIMPGAVLVRSAGPGSGLTLTGVIDLAGGALLARAGPTLAAWRTDIIAGRNGGAWNGTSPGGSVNSSLAAGTPSRDGVGYGLGSQIGVTAIGSFGIGANDTLLRYTRDGDADLSGAVNLADFNRLASNFGLAGRAWTDGDFNYDAAVNLTDLNALAGNFGASPAADPFGGQLTRGARGDEELRKLLGQMT